MPLLGLMAAPQMPAAGGWRQLLLCALEYLIKNFKAQHLFSVQKYSLLWSEAKQTGVSRHKLYTTPSIFRATIELKHRTLLKNNSPFKLEIWTKLMFTYFYSHCTWC